MPYDPERASISSIEEVGATPDEMVLLARLIVSAAPAFYGLLPCAEDEMLALIAKQIGEPGTELQGTYILRYEGRVCSVISAIEDAQVDTARLASTMSFARRLNRSERGGYLAALQRYGKALEPIAESGTYIARLATRPDAIATGTGARLLKWFLRRSGPGLYTCHVHKENATAMWLNRKAGFSFTSGSDESPFDYRALSLRQ